ncbi:ABC-three component system protein [Schaalia suimastitidis]|uniref:ABC-three component system protein n=1 Tax=Schaalia suimastitidis TaxID=121163 RepID=UPI0003FE9AB3|nr:ABC-three component system protein [Schaalia suimastitidis]
MKLPDLFHLLDVYCPTISHGDLLLAISDMSLPSKLRGPGNNLLYGPYKHKKQYEEAERLKVERTARQRWIVGERKIQRELARFWHRNFDIPSMIDALDKCWRLNDCASEIATILRSNGYAVKREGVSDFLATMLKQGLERIPVKGSDNSIDNKPWDGSLVGANMDDISAIGSTKVLFSGLGKDDIKVVGESLFLGSIEIPLPPCKPIPETVDRMERNYLRQVLLAIGTVSQLDVESLRPRHAPFDEIERVRSDLEGSYKEFVRDVTQARDGYFHADHLRMIMRDHTVDGVEEFEKIKDDTYFAVHPTVRRSHSDAFEKMQATLEKAVSAPLQSSHVTSVSGLFTAKHRHGITHMLVNDNRIAWVSDDD